MHNRRTFLTFAASAPVATATAGIAPNSITIPISPFATCEEPVGKKVEKSTIDINGKPVSVEVRYTSRQMTQITLWSRD